MHHDYCQEEDASRRRFSKIQRWGAIGRRCMHYHISVVKLVTDLLKAIIKVVYIQDIECMNKSIETFRVKAQLSSGGTLTSNQGSYLLPLVSNNWSDLPPMAASHGCLYLYSGHAITHHLPDHLFWLQPLHTAIHPQPPLQESSLPSQHLPSLYVHPTQSLRIDFKSTRIHLLALCGTPALQTVRTMPTPPSMDFAVPTAMLEHQNTSPSSCL